MWRADAGGPVRSRPGPRPGIRLQVPLEVRGPIPEALRTAFVTGLAQALRSRQGVRGLTLLPGRNRLEVVVQIAAFDRTAPLPLYFPRAAELDSDDISRIVGSVLEGMGPLAPSTKRLG